MCGSASDRQTSALKSPARCSESQRAPLDPYGPPLDPYGHPLDLHGSQYKQAPAVVLNRSIGGRQLSHLSLSEAEFEMGYEQQSKASSAAPTPKARRGSRAEVPLETPAYTPRSAIKIPLTPRGLSRPTSSARAILASPTAKFGPSTLDAIAMLASPTARRAHVMVRGVVCVHAI